MSANNYIGLTTCVGGAGSGTRDNGCSICGQVITSSESSTAHITRSNIRHTLYILQRSEVLERRRENTTCSICRQCPLPRDLRGIYQSLPGWLRVVETMEANGCMEWEAEPGYILAGDVTFVVTPAGEIIPATEFYQSLLGWSLVLE